MILGHLYYSTTFVGWAISISKVGLKTGLYGSGSSSRAILPTNSSYLSTVYGNAGCHWSSTDCRIRDGYG
eukprot:9049862-Pyramimonas_sp.AAC.1